MRMHFRRWKHYGHKYLGRMALTSVLLLLLPCLFALYIMMHQAYSGLMDSVRAGYTETIRDFSSDYLRQLNEMRTMALRLSMKSRDSSSELYVLQQENAEVNPYYYSEMTDAVGLYSLYTGHEMMVYFPELDALIRSQNKYTADSFSEYASARYVAQDTDAFYNFLQEPQTEGAISFFSTCEQPGGVMYISFSIRIGVSKRPAKVVYLIESGDLNTIALMSQLNDFAQLGVYDDTGTLLYISSPLQMQWNAVPDAIARGKNTVVWDDVSYELFYQDDNIPFRYVLLIPYQQLTYSLSQFYQMLQTIIILAGIVLAVAVLVMLFINYTPVFRIVSKYGIENERDEFDSLAKSFEIITTENSDKEMVIMDLLYRNMLYGVPIPENQAMRLKRTGARAFCVVTISPLRMTSEESGQLMGTLYEQLQVQIYMTDLLPEERTALICCMDETTAEQLSACVIDWVQAHFQEDIGVYTGTVVDTINDIHQSFCVCDELEKQSHIAPAVPVQEMDALTQQILDYIKENYADLNLSRTMVADHFRISVYSLSRVFKNQLNIGFSEYLINCRLEHVVQLLLTTNQSVAEISDACGFASSSYLAKLFKSVYNQTPMQYRKNEREKRGLPDPD